MDAYIYYTAKNIALSRKNLWILQQFLGPGLFSSAQKRLRNSVTLARI